MVALIGSSTLLAGIQSFISSQGSPIAVSKVKMCRFPWTRFKLFFWSVQPLRILFIVAVVCGRHGGCWWRNGGRCARRRKLVESGVPELAPGRAAVSSPAEGTVSLGLPKAFGDVFSVVGTIIVPAVSRLLVSVFDAEFPCVNVFEFGVSGVWLISQNFVDGLCAIAAVGQGRGSLVALQVNT